MKTVAIIPARGGSKGIPGKNIRPLNGTPLIVHTIIAAQQAVSVDAIVVSTDDLAISETAAAAGAEIVRRPAEISGDSVSSEAALLHALRTLEERHGFLPDLIVFLQCTSPLTMAADIDATVAILLDEHADTALTVAPFHYYLWALDKNGMAIGLNHDIRHRPMRQRREQQFIETGAVYVMRVPGFLKYRHRFFGTTVFHVTPEGRCCEIDERIDWVVAEAMQRFIEENDNS